MTFGEAMKAVVDGGKRVTRHNHGSWYFYLKDYFDDEDGSVTVDVVVKHFWDGRETLKLRLSREDCHARDWEVV